MKHLLRYYLHNVGVSNAWFNDLLVECCNETSEKPQDTVIVADNQTGKTTTLSLLFTVLQPNEQRFIQASSQDSNRKFADYFDSTYLRPGIMVLEFDSGATNARGIIPGLAFATKHFLVGQVVVMDAQGGYQRRYFSIRCLRGVTLKALIHGDEPCKGLALNALASLSHFKEWVVEMRQRFRGRRDDPNAECDFEIFDAQGVWIRHLCDSFGIDPELVNVQVQMNLREAGIKDAEMFKYKDERDFLRKFMKFCLNEGESDKVVESVRQGLERIKEIPRYEKMLFALEAIQLKFQPFKEASERLVQAQAALAQEQSKGLGLKRAAELERDLALVAQSQHEGNLLRVKEDWVKANQELVQTQNQIRGIEDFQRGVQHRIFTEQYEQERNNLMLLKRRHNLLMAREVLNSLDTLRAQTKNYLELLNQEQASIADLAEGVMVAGRDCKVAITNNVYEIKSEISKLDDEIKKLDLEVRGFATQRKKAGRELSDTVSLASSLDQKLENGKSEREHLVKKNVLLADESAAAGLTRLRVQRQALDADVAALDEHVSELRKEIARLDKEIENANPRLEKLGGNILEIQKRLDKEESTAKHLRELCRELGLADTTEIDLNSPLIRSGLEERRCKTGESFARLHIEKEALAKDKRCIESFHVRGVDHDVTAVVEQIRARGGDAMPYSLWLAKQYPDEPAQARNLFLSDPARFSGVLVHTSKKFNKLREDTTFSESLPLTRTVTVSLPSLEDRSTLEDQFVLGPDGDALYNERAAQLLLHALDGQVAELDQNISQLEGQRNRFDRLQAALEAWSQEFGDGRLKYTRDSLDRLKEEKATFHQRLAGIKNNIIEKKDLLHQKEETKREFIGEVNSILSLQDSVERYKREHEDHRAKYEEKLIEANHKIKQLEREQEELDKASEKAIAISKRLEQDKLPLTARRGSLSQQMQQIHMSHELIPGQVVAESIEELMAIYENRYTHYQAAASGKVVQYQDLLRALEKQVQEKEQTLKTKYADLAEEEIRAVQSVDLTADLSRLSPKLEDLELQVNYLSKQRDKLENERQNWRKIWKKQKEEYWPPEDMDETKATTGCVVALLQATQHQEKDINHTLIALAATRCEIEKALQESKDRHNTFVVAVRSLEIMEHPELAPEPITGTLETAQLDAIVEAAVKGKVAAEREVNKAQNKAFSSHKEFRNILDDEQVRKYAQHECAIIAANGVEHFDSFCEQSVNVSQHLANRIRAVDQMIQDKESDIEICAKALQKLVEDGIRLLKRAMGITIPGGVERIGGQPILTLRQVALDLQAPLFDLMKERLRQMVRDGDSPENGQAMVANTLWHITAERSRSLQIKLLKPEPTLDGYSLVPVGKLALSGAEGITVAMMLYLVSARLRAEAHGRQVGSCGVLLMDNPFGEANKPWLVKIQRALAQAMDIQLIYFSGVKDPNTLYTFSRHIHMRQSGRLERTTGRQCVEAIRLQVHEDAGT
ncbi:hypothetical protein [Desulfonatronum lacustre]|uniref:hypothetical protein n=1 Tax=Desulfonatronum lacustre TaxID=66849 RepID=UPI00048E2FB3|nr:hypothetical protein [Desulfonatronum lacustre]